MHMFITLSKR